MKATLKNLLNGEEIRVKSTTNHPASSYGKSVWVDEDENAYGQVGLPILGYEVEEFPELDEIAYQNGLQLIETTDQITGYPKCIRQAIIGFTRFEDAKELAEKYGLSIEFFTKRAGWDMWYRTGNTAYEGITVTSEYYGEDYGEYDSSEIPEMLETICEMDDAEEIKANLQTLYGLQSEFLKKQKGEFILTHHGVYHSTRKRHTMLFEEDGKYTAIGLIDRGED